MDRSRLAIVIPAYNEEKTIQRVLTEVSAYGTPIVVDDGSADKTALIANAQGAIVVSHKRNYGYDQALNSGFNKASELGFSIIMTFDADGQHSVNLINQFIESIDRGADAVIGNRIKKARFSEVVFSWVAIILWRIKDPLCGMKAYRLELYREMGYFDSYGSIGSELCIFAAKRNYSISQISIDVCERLDEPRVGNALKANLTILRAIILSILK